MILLILLLISTPVHADIIDWLNGYNVASVINDCGECDDCRETNKILRNKIIKLEQEKLNGIQNK